jgi:hypothetical protein
MAEAIANSRFLTDCYSFLPQLPAVAEPKSGFTLLGEAYGLANGSAGYDVGAAM